MKAKKSTRKSTRKTTRKSTRSGHVAVATRKERRRK